MTDKIAAENLARFPVGTRVRRTTDHACDIRQAEGHIANALATVVQSGYAIRIRLDNGAEAMANRENLEPTERWVARKEENHRWMAGQHALVIEDNGLRITVQVPGQPFPVVWVASKLKETSTTGPLGAPRTHLKMGDGTIRVFPAHIAILEKPQARVRKSLEVTADTFRVQLDHGHRVAGITLGQNLMHRLVQDAMDNTRAELAALKTLREAIQNAHTLNQEANRAQDYAWKAKDNAQKAEGAVREAQEALHKLLGR